ncbi:hypothetical protein RRG08_002745 [Elysia crispata]|uniref:Uncharacterized protein n=1 Tax=Elysia crispata TaxID=231223 RepID=A0AAE0XU90_9GAST|nr:hypothetical protein RRG08_002745 [Elysia crispata]
MIILVVSRYLSVQDTVAGEGKSRRVSSFITARPAGPQSDWCRSRISRVETGESLGVAVSLLHWVPWVLFWCGTVWSVECGDQTCLTSQAGLVAPPSPRSTSTSRDL